MKKTLLTTAILVGLASATVQAATVYEKEGTTMSIGGRVEVRADFIDTYDEDSDSDATVKDMSRARINFAGETQISKNVTGFGFMEYQIEPGDDVKNRYLFAGFGTNVGDFSYGRQDTANVQVSDMTDIASVHSGQQQYINSASDKENSTLLYSETFIDALTVKANFIAGETEDSDSFGVSGLYAFDFGLDLAASYTAADEDDDNQTTLGAAYAFKNLYLAVTYATGEDGVDNEFTSLEGAIQYKFTKGLRVIGIIGVSEDDTEDTNDFFAVETQYRFNKSIRTFVSYQLNNLDDTDDSLVAGIRYNF